MRVDQPAILKDLKFLLSLVVANTFAHSDGLCFGGRCGRSGLPVGGSCGRVVTFVGGGLRILPPLGAVDKNALGRIIFLVALNTHGLAVLNHREFILNRFTFHFPAGLHRHLDFVQLPVH